MQPWPEKIVAEPEIYKFDTRADTRAPTLVTSTPYGQGQLMHHHSVNQPITSSELRCFTDKVLW